MHVVTAQTGEQEFRELRERSVDLMLGRILKPLDDEEVAAEVLCDDAFSVVADANSPWARRRKVSLAELAKEPWVLFPANSISASYLAAGFRANRAALPTQCVTTFSLQLRMHLLATGRYLTILQDSVLRFSDRRWSLKALPIDLRIEPAPIAAFTLKGRTLSAVVELFLEYAREVAKSTKKAARA